MSKSTESQNQRRAAWADHALQEYLSSKKAVPSPALESDIVDLVNGLLRLAIENGIDPSKVLQTAAVQLNVDTRQTLS
jgi:hypothetical protein